MKKDFEFEQVHELENDEVQSVWLKGGYKKSKKIYYCHGYREHTTRLGNSISIQRQSLQVFLQQWEMAVEHGAPVEPNEVHVSGDMNLDCLGGKWLDPDYDLLSLSKLFKNTCNSHNLFQGAN